MNKYLLLFLFSLVNWNLTAQSFSLDFEDISTLQFISRSEPTGTLSWSRGYPANANLSAYFKAYKGTDSSYLSNSFQAADAAGVGGATISEWFILPTQTIKEGDSLYFWTRTANFSGTAYPDRLQVRAAASATTNVGVNAIDTGDFTILLRDINPHYTPSGYPTSWTKQVCIIDTLATSFATYTFALRYFVEDGGPVGANSGVIGIDNLKFSPWVPTVGITNLSPTLQLHTYPNPCKTELTVDFGKVLNTTTTCTLSKVNGQIIGSTQFYAGTAAHRLGVSQLPSGTYIITVESEGKLSSSLFVKQ